MLCSLAAALVLARELRDGTVAVAAVVALALIALVRDAGRLRFAVRIRMLRFVWLASGAAPACRNTVSCPELRGAREAYAII